MGNVLTKSEKQSDTQGYMVQLDGLRFFAVLSVMVGHWLTYDILKSITGFFASAGVNLFFVLSGFLITLILFKSKDADVENNGRLLKKFYVRRFLRIFPLYYLIVLIGFIFNIPSLREELFWFLTYTANIIIGQNGGNSGYFTHLWSLCVEEQFYLVFPFIILYISSKNYKLLFGLMIFIGLISRLATCFLLFGKSNMEWAAYSFTPCCLDSFGIGAYLSYLFLYNQNQLKRILNLKYLFIFLFLIGISLFIISHAYHILEVLSYAVVRTLISVFSFWVIGLASLNKLSGFVKLIIENNAVVYLGKISYGLYVYHHFMPFLFNYLGVRLGIDITSHSKIIDSALYFLVAVLISSVSWFYFENPFNKLKRYFSYSSIKKVVV